MATEAAECNDNNFDFNHVWWYTILSTSVLFLSYIAVDYMRNAKARRNPSILLLFRAIADTIAVVVVLYSIASPAISCATIDDHARCRFWGALFLFSLYVSAIYYGGICHQLYYTLKDPFKRPSSHSLWFHLAVLLICFVIVAVVGSAGNDGLGQFEYRASFQTCFLRKQDGLNPWNVIVIYVPVVCIVFFGLLVNAWSIRQLRRRVRDDTFQLRWMQIKTQTAIITCFTVNYVLQGCLWIALFQETEERPVHDPYVLSCFVHIAVLFDALTWFVRRYVMHRYSHQDYHQTVVQEKQQQQSEHDQKPKIEKRVDEISDALRLEIITFILAGLAQSAKRNSAKNVLRKRKRSFFNTVSEENGNHDDNEDNGNTLDLPLLNNTAYPDSNGNNGRDPKSSATATVADFVRIGIFSKMFAPPVIEESYFLTASGEEENSQHAAAAAAPEHLLSEPQPSNNAMAVTEEHLLNDGFYPKKLGPTKYDEHVIEPYHIGLVGAEQTNVVFADYAPVVFSYLRRNVYGVSDAAYQRSILPASDINAISNALKAKFSEGRSGAFLFFTKDSKYLIKTLTKPEAKLLLSTLKSYALYMKQNPQSFLSKYFGLHSITLYSHSIYFTVTANVFPAKWRAPDEVYDIKGSWVDRHTNHHVTARKLMKDEDLHTKMKLTPAQSRAMFAQLDCDTQFLASNDIMDYSLLLGIYYNRVHRAQIAVSPTEHSGSDADDEGFAVYHSVYVEGPGKYCIGVIDMLQEWNLNKRSERVIKGLRGKDKNGVSCVPPIYYQQRFMNKMREIGIGEQNGYSIDDGDAYMCAEEDEEQKEDAVQCAQLQSAQNSQAFVV